MKDIYELLNDVEIDTNEYENLGVNIAETTKKRLKNNVNNKIIKVHKERNKTLKSICKIGGVAVLLFVIIGITNPTIAKTISDTIKYFEESRIYTANFERYSKGVDLTTVDNKISIKLNSVVYDGASLYLAYEVNTETPLEYGVKIWSTDLVINGKKIKGSEKRKLEGHDFNEDIYKSYDYRIEKNQNNEKYVVATSWDLTECKLDDTKSEDIAIQWNINNIHGIAGKWSFKFKASKKELMDKSKIFRNIGEVSFNDIQKYKLDKFIVNPLETRMELTQITNKAKFEEYKNKNNNSEDELDGFNLTYNNLILTDNNEELSGLGGSGYGAENKNGEKIVKLSYNFYGLNKMPKELKIIPVKRKVGFSEAVDLKFIKIKDLKDGMELVQGKDKSIAINSLEKKNNEFIMNISFKGIDINRRSDLFIVEDKDKYLTLLNNKDFEKIEVKEQVDFSKDLKNYNIKGNMDVVFKDVNIDGWLAYLDYDNTYELDMENAKIIKLN